MRPFQSAEAIYVDYLLALDNTESVQVPRSPDCLSLYPALLLRPVTLRQPDHPKSRLPRLRHSGFPTIYRFPNKGRCLKALKLRFRRRFFSAESWGAEDVLLIWGCWVFFFGGVVLGVRWLGVCCVGFGVLFGWYY